MENFLENFKTLLNKCNDSNHKFVKLCNLEEGKKYEVTGFENINTRYGKKVTVILNDEYKIILPDDYINICNENMTKYNLSSNRLNLTYNGLKYSRHLINFE